MLWHPPQAQLKKEKEEKIAPGDPILNQDNRMGVQRAEACSPRWLKSSRSCDVSDLRSVCYCIMAGSTRSPRRGHHWSVSTTTMLAFTLQQSCDSTARLVEMLAPSDIDQSAVMVHMMQQPTSLFSLCALSKISDIIIPFKITWWLFLYCLVMHHLTFKAFFIN